MVRTRAAPTGPIRLVRFHPRAGRRWCSTRIFFGPSLTWNISLARGTTPFGGDVQVELVAKLSARGYVVLQPEVAGGIAWNTNSGGDYGLSSDAVFIPQLLDRIANGTFGPIDMTRLYAAGISSGGYMTSRMAVSYPGRFRALAVQSGSYSPVRPICNGALRRCQWMIHRRCSCTAAPTRPYRSARRRIITTNYKRRASPRRSSKILLRATAGSSPRRTRFSEVVW